MLRLQWILRDDSMLGHGASLQHILQVVHANLTDWLHDKSSAAEAQTPMLQLIMAVCDAHKCGVHVASDFSQIRPKDHRHPITADLMFRPHGDTTMHPPDAFEMNRWIPAAPEATAGAVQDGSSIISGWSDGKIRAFGPQSGKLLFTIHDAHHQGVTAIQGLGDSRHVVSGGGEGLVRLWAINPNSQTMVASMKEHKVSPMCHCSQRSDHNMHL